jgi:hypothetical protein
MIAAVLLVVGAATYALWPTSAAAPEDHEQWAGREPARAAQTADTAQEQALIEPRVAEPVDAQSPGSQDVGEKPLEEPALMAKLRALGATSPELALSLARQGNARFPNSRGAAERAWFVVKSLDSLGRFHEGRAEAHTMVERYRGSSWANDVERHTLVYPLDQPSREEMQARERDR